MGDKFLPCVLSPRLRLPNPKLELELHEIENLIHGKYVTFIYNIYFVYK